MSHRQLTPGCWWLIVFFSIIQLHFGMQWIHFPVYKRAIALLSYEWPKNIRCVFVLNFLRGMCHGASIVVLQITHKRQAPLKDPTKFFRSFPHSVHFNDSCSYLWRVAAAMTAKHPFGVTAIVSPPLLFFASVSIRRISFVVRFGTLMAYSCCLFYMHKNICRTDILTFCKWTSSIIPLVDSQLFKIDSDDPFQYTIEKQEKTHRSKMDIEYDALKFIIDFVSSRKMRWTASHIKFYYISCCIHCTAKSIYYHYQHHNNV